MAAVALVLVAALFLPQGSYSLVSGVQRGGPLRMMLTLLLMMIVVAILAATIVQARRVYRRTRSDAVPRCSGREPAVRAGAARVVLRTRGWRERTLPGGAGFVFSKHSWSAWSGVILHVGLLLVMAGLAATVGTESRTEYLVRTGERLDGSAQVMSVSRAWLSGDTELAGALTLDKVVPEYWPSGELRAMNSYFTDVSSGEAVTVSVNTITRWSGGRLFQTRVYGRVLDVLISGPGLPETRYRVDVEGVPVIGAPGYRDIEIAGIPGEVRFRSIETQGHDGAVPRITIRLEEGGTVCAEEELVLGQPVDLAGYTATLDRYDYWQTVYYTQQQGAGMVIVGTVLVGLGSLAFYLIPYARIYILADGDTHRLIVSASKLARSAISPRVRAIIEECA